MTNRYKFFIRPIGIQDVCVLIGFISLVVFQMKNFSDDPGVGWHLKTGEIVSSTLEIPYIDPFLASKIPRPWISDQWLSDLVLYKIYSFGSWPLLYALLTVLYLVTYFVILYGGVRSFGGSPLGAAVTTLLAFKVAQIHFLLRPVMFSFLFFAVTYLSIYKIYGALKSHLPISEMLTSINRTLIFLPLVFLLWANMHPAFILGLVIVAILPVSLVLDWVLFGRHFDLVHNRAIGTKIGLLVILSVLATFINPYGINLHKSIFALSQSSYFMDLHMEWKSPNFKLLEGQLFEVGWLFVIAAVFLVPNKRLKWGAFEISLIIVFSHLGLKAVRVLPFFGIAASIPFCQALAHLGNASIFRRYPELSRVRRAFEWINFREANSYGGLPFTAILSCWLILSVLFSDKLPLYSGSYGPPAEKFPIQAVEILNKEVAKLTEKATNPITVGSIPDWGGYLAMYGDPILRPMIDDRNALLGEGFYKEYYKALSPPSDWEGYFRTFNTQFMLLPRRTTLAEMLFASAALPVIYKDDLAILFKGPE